MDGRSLEFFPNRDPSGGSNRTFRVMFFGRKTKQKLGHVERVTAQELLSSDTGSCFVHEQKFINVCKHFYQKLRELYQGRK